MKENIVFSVIAIFVLIGCTTSTSRNDAAEILSIANALLNTTNTPNTANALLNTANMPNTAVVPMNTANMPNSAEDTSLPASCEQFYSAINTLAQDKPPELIAQFHQMVADKRKAWKNMNSAERDRTDKNCVMLQKLYLGR